MDVMEMFFLTSNGIFGVQFVIKTRMIKRFAHNMFEMQLLVVSVWRKCSETRAKQLVIVGILSMWQTCSAPCTRKKRSDVFAGGIPVWQRAAWKTRLDILDCTSSLLTPYRDAAINASACALLVLATAQNCNSCSYVFGRALV